MGFFNLSQSGHLRTFVENFSGCLKSQQQMTKKAAVFGGLFLAFSAPLGAQTTVLPSLSSWNAAKVVAAGDRLEAPHYNLSQAAFESAYSFAFAYSSAGDQLRAQITDTSREGALGGTIFYGQREFSAAAVAADSSLGNFERLEQHAGAGLTMKLNETVAVSLTGRYLYLRPVSGNLSSHSFWTGDIGVSAILASNWRLLLSGQNLLRDDEGATYRNFSVALETRPMPQLRSVLQVDFVKAPEGTADTGFSAEEKPSISVGLDYSLQENIGLSAGYASLGSWEQQQVGLGLSYSHENFEVAYGLKFSTNSSSATYHGLSFSADL